MDGTNPILLNAMDDLTQVWLQSLQVLAQTTGGYKDFREIESLAAQSWLKRGNFSSEKSSDPYQVAQAFATYLNTVCTDREVYVEKGGEVITLRITGKCPYTLVYVNTQRKGMTPLDLQAGLFIAVIKEATGQDFRSKMQRFVPGESYDVNLLPLEVGLKVGISYKLGKGTIRISESSIEDLGLGIVDTVTVRHMTSGRTVVAQSYSSSKVAAGSVVMSVLDAKLIGLKEGDKVLIEKGTGLDFQEAELVED